MGEMMKAAAIAAYDGPASVVVGDWPHPSKPGPGEVIVQVQACGINPLDWKVCDGAVASFLDRAPPFIIGADVAGIVAAIGEGVARHHVGDAVFGQIGLVEGFAQYACTGQYRLVAIPDGMSFTEAACMPISGNTALDLLFKDGGLQAGERVLVQGGAGGVGHYAVQLAKDAGAYVLATCSAASADFVRALGADEVIDYHAAPFEEAVRDIDLVVDTVGGDVLTRSWAVLKSSGRMTTSVPPTGSLEYQGRMAKFSIGKPDEDGANLDHLAALAKDGRARPHIQQIFAFADVAQALALSKAGHVHGKLALQIVD